MTKTTLLLALLLSQSTMANIINSDYDVRMDNVIVDAIINKCNVMTDLTLVKSVQKLDPVDQGVVDILYTSTFTGKQRYDQDMFDTYDITVKTWYYDMYDMSSGEWGDYAVKSVECTIR